LDTLGSFNNIVFVLGEEYSGPAQFVRFWLDSIGQWSRENNRDVLVMLSACRDVQEDILAASEYAQLVDIIDVKYWWYTKDGAMYDPPGGDSQAPRQQLRAWTGPKSRSLESTCRSVRDLKARFPEKAVVCSLPSESPWLLLAAGCSLPELPKSTEEGLLRGLVLLRPETSKPEWSLDDSSSAERGSRKMIVTAGAMSLQSTLASQARVVNPQNGRIQPPRETNPQSFSEKNPHVLWIDGTD
jgi:hypothetical protein